MIYKAFLNRQEITGFPVEGKDTTKIYGGDILLWEKSGIPPMKEICAVRTVWTHVDYDGTQYPCECEISVRNQTEDGKIYFTDIEKAGIYVKQENQSIPGSSYYESVCIMFKAKRVPSTILQYINQKNVLYTLRMRNMKGELLDETISWEMSHNSMKGSGNIFGVGASNSDGTFLTSPRPMNYGPGPSTPAFPATIYTSGSGAFKSAEDVLKYMLEE